MFGSSGASTEGVSANGTVLTRGITEASPTRVGTVRRWTPTLYPSAYLTTFAKLEPNR